MSEAWGLIQTHYSNIWTLSKIVNKKKALQYFLLLICWKKIFFSASDASNIFIEYRNDIDNNFFQILKYNFVFWLLWFCWELIWSSCKGNSLSFWFALPMVPALFVIWLLHCDVTSNVFGFDTLHVLWKILSHHLFRCGICLDFLSNTLLGLWHTYISILPYLYVSWIFSM